ncbi:hypothetical protein IFM89_001831 [Coptis chinensis]|uniref:Ribosomal RNA small subunit methyltransferase NEP1 n=1 Tax=Coptis chinensis TaxID=261450 RepID=A0A835HFY6_9MAGN|nr:hypothetical protein IFM89_001831 [Coptis chinensis]
MRENETSIPKEDEIKIKEVANELPKMPMVPTSHCKKPGVIFVFEKASLVPAFVDKKYQLLNSDDHANFLRRKKMDPYKYRPDIIFYVSEFALKCFVSLLEIMDSTLYKTGRVEAIYVKTEEGELIKIEPNTRIPDLQGSFCSMMLELLQKFSIKAKGSRETLLRLVKNPVSQYLPANYLKIGFSFSSNKVVDLDEYVGAVNDDVNLVFVVGAMAHGKIDCDYADDIISVANFPLSAAICTQKICFAVENKWKLK